MRFVMPERDEDELEFDDEVDYPHTINLREKYHKYKGLKSFKKSDWDKYENLPDEYEKIIYFKNYLHSRKKAIEHATKNAFAYEGMYIRLYI